MSTIENTFSDFSDASMEPAEVTLRKQRIQSLRAYADFLEEHPTANVDLSSGEVMEYCDTADEMAAKARTLGGMWSKRTTDYFFYLDREVCPGVVYHLYSSRDIVCERVVVGQEPKEVADPEALAAVPKITQMVDKVEWRCPDSLLAMTGEGVDDTTSDA